jgi:hypothetical protein
MTPIESNTTITNRICRSNFVLPGPARSNAPALERFPDALRQQTQDAERLGMLPLPRRSVVTRWGTEPLRSNFARPGLGNLFSVTLALLRIPPFILRPLANSLTRSFNWLAIGVTLTAFTAYLRTLAPTITWRHGGADSGDLAAAVATLGIAHPPGYPTYILLGRIWSWLPLGGGLAYRLNLLSATCAAAAAGLTVLTIAYLGQQQIKAKLSLAIGAMMGGLFLAFAPLTWSQATITEVYAPGLAVLSLLSWLLFKWTHQPQRWLLFLAGLVAGLGFGVLPQIVLAVPGALLLLSGQNDLSYCKRLLDVQLWRRLGLLLLGTLIGLSIFVYLPLRASAHPLINWGDPTTPARFWAVVTAAQYHQYTTLLTPGEWFERLFASLFQLKQALSWAGLGLAGLGGYCLWRSHQAILIYLLSLTGLTLLFQISYPVVGNIVYLLPVVYSLALLAGLGAASLLAMAQSQMEPLLGPRLGRSGVMLLGFSFLITLGVRAVVTAPQLDLSHDDQAARFGQQIFAALPPEAIVVSNRDETTFSLWYRQALGERPDVVVIDKRLLAYEWYQHHLEQRHPNLDLANGLSSSSQPVYFLTGAPGEEMRSLFNPTRN